MPIQPDILDEMNRLIVAAGEQSILLRVLGGLAVRVHQKSDHSTFTREFGDLDFVVAGKQRRAFESFMPQTGYAPHKQFNLLNGAHRQIYYHNATEMKVDIFIGTFEMCHKIPLEDRLHIHPITIPLAELLLTKVQIAELNRKDALDVASLLLYNELGEEDEGKINLLRIAQLCREDWGLYKTTSINLNRVQEIIGEQDVNLTEEERKVILERVKKIQKTFKEMPKSLAWRLRDKVGTRVRWYTEVEEVRR